jgi:CMP-N,N'-diacetyllegionaminic acid synthase
MKYLAFIPARAGSKGIPDKNKVLLNNKPLIAFTFEAAQNSKLLDEAHLSTNDDEILEIAKDYNILSLYKRPEEIAGDNATIYETLLFHINFLKSNKMDLPDNIVLLQPTSPLRSKDLIDNCIIEFQKSGQKSLVAVSETIQHPYETFKRENGKNIFISNTNEQRQQYPQYYFITGSVYIATLDFILHEKSFFNEDSAIYIVKPFEAVDIDDSSDLDLAYYYLTKNNGL